MALVWCVWVVVMAEGVRMGVWGLGFENGWLGMSARLVRWWVVVPHHIDDFHPSSAVHRAAHQWGTPRPAPSGSKFPSHPPSHTLVLEPQ